MEFRTRDEDFGLASREKHVGDTYISIQGVGDFSIKHTYIFDDGTLEGQTSFIEAPSIESVWCTDIGPPLVPADCAVWATSADPKIPENAGEWGGSDVTVRHRLAGIGSSPTIGHRFKHEGTNQPFWVGLINQEVMISGPTDDSTAEGVD